MASVFLFANQISKFIKSLNQLRSSSIRFNNILFSECGDGNCEEGEGETCDNCPADCGNCPLKVWQLALIGLAAAIVVGGIIAVFIVSITYCEIN